MKAFFKNKIFIASVSVVAVVAIAVTSFLLIPKSTAAGKGPGDEELPQTSSAAPADLNMPLSDTASEPTASPENQEEKVIPADESQPAKTPSAENGKVEAGNKTPPVSPTQPPDKVESGAKPAPPPKEDSVKPGGSDSKEDYTPKPGDEPHFGAGTDNPPPNNIDEIPDYDIDDTPGDTEGGGKPGEGTKF